MDDEREEEDDVAASADCARANVRPEEGTVSEVAVEVVPMAPESSWLWLML